MNVVMTRWAGVIELAWENVQEPPISKIFENSLGLSLDDPDVSPEEKQRIIDAGGDKLHALPTIYLTSSKRPMVVLEKMLGGISPNTPKKEQDMFINDIHKLIMKWQRKEMQLMGYWRQEATQHEEEEPDGHH
jgi:hypothetical protein